MIIIAHSPSNFFISDFIPSYHLASPLYLSICRGIVYVLFDVPRQMNVLSATINFIFFSLTSKPAATASLFKSEKAASFSSVTYLLWQYHPHISGHGRFC